MEESEIFDEEPSVPGAVSLAVTETSSGERVDSFVSSSTGLTRSAVSKLAEKGEILLNGSPVKKNTRLKSGDTVDVFMPSPEPCTAEPQDIPVDVIYEDDDIIVVNKPQGMVVHPAAGNPDGTLVNALLYHCRGSLSGIGGVLRPGIVHRIDKDTGGLLVVAKNDAAHVNLAAQIKEHEVSRIYYAVALGNFRDDSGTVDAPIGRHPTDRKRMAVIRDPMKKSRDAVTHWNVIRRFGRFTLIRCQLETGRTHQIRVHMSGIGHPLLGDSVYGGSGTDFEARHSDIIHGQCLFAAELRLRHPSSGEMMEFKADFPADLRMVLEKLGEEYGEQ